MPFPTAGVGGSVRNGANTVLNVDMWDIAIKGNVKETTSFGASGSWAQNTATIRSWTCKVNGRVDPSDTNGQLALMNGVGSTFSMSFYVDATKFWSGSAILTGFSPKADVNDTATVQYDFTGTGALTLT